MEAVGVGSITEVVPLQDEAAIRRDFPKIMEVAVKRPAGAAELHISMMERLLHAPGGREEGRLRLSQMPLGCGQVLISLEGRRAMEERK